MWIRTSRLSIRNPLSLDLEEAEPAGLPAPGLERENEVVEERLRYHLSPRETKFFIDNLLVRIHFIIEIILVDRPVTMICGWWLVACGVLGFEVGFYGARR